MYDICVVKGREFVARARKYAKSQNLDFQINPSRGKGSHTLIWIGKRLTVVTSGEIKKGSYHAMLKQLGIRQGEF